MKVHLINPSGLSFGVGVITPRWLYVLAAATPDSYGDPVITDETLEPWDSASVQAGDVVGIGGFGLGLGFGVTGDPVLPPVHAVIHTASTASRDTTRDGFLMTGYVHYCPA